jgi:outer membrane autotransporter protein
LSYTIIEADGGVSGAFATVQDNLPDLDFVVSYGDTAVTLTYTGSAGDTTPKELHGAGLASLPGLATSGVLSGVTQGALGGGDGLTFASKGQTAGSAGGGRGWGQILGIFENAHDIGTTPGWQANTGGLMVGGDMVPDTAAPAVLGAAFGYTDTRFNSGASTGQVDGFHLALYAGTRSGPLRLTGSLGAGYQSYDFTRRFTAAGAAREAKGSTSGYVLNGSVEGFYDIADLVGLSAPSSAAALGFGPFAGLTVGYGRFDGFTETGAGVLNLTVGDTEVTRVQSVLGLSGSLDLDMGGRRLVLDGSLGWEHVFQGRSVTTGSTIGVAGAAFTSATAPIDSDRVAVGIGAAYAVSDRMTATIRYDGRIGSRGADHRASAGLNIAF